MNRMIRFLLSASVLPLSANAELGTTYKEGPVTQVTYLKIEYGHFDEYVDWLNSTWKPLNEAKNEGGADHRLPGVRRQPKEA